MRIKHTKDPVIRMAEWKRCHHINDCTCTKQFPFEELCQTCGKPAKWTMKFAYGKVTLYACNKCMGERYK